MQFIKKEAAFIPKSQIKVFVSGGGGDVADAVVACLNKSELDFEITIASSSEISLRHYEVDNYALLPLVDSGKYVESLMRALNHYEIDIFIPTIDSELSLISENAKFITSKTGTVVFIGESSDVMQFGDKLATAEFLKKNELPYPNTILADDGLKLQRFLQSVTFPIIAKPRFGHGSIGVIEIKTLKDLTGTLKTNNYILQEKLPVGSWAMIETLRPDSNDDKFGRILGVFITEDGTRVNQWMIDNNYAVLYLGENKELVQEAHQQNKKILIERGELPNK